MDHQQATRHGRFWERRTYIWLPHVWEFVAPTKRTQPLLRSLTASHAFYVFPFYPAHLYPTQWLSFISCVVGFSLCGNGYPLFSRRISVRFFCGIKFPSKLRKLPGLFQLRVTNFHIPDTTTQDHMSVHRALSTLTVLINSWGMWRSWWLHLCKPTP